MQPIINEWQLDTTLNRALQNQHRADFALWLAVLSPAVNEMAAFFTPETAQCQPQHDLYQQLSVRPSRDFAWQDDDTRLMRKHSEAVLTSLAQLKLEYALNPAPWVRQNNPKKIEGDVYANLDSHTRRRLQGILPSKTSVDETGLYEILQQLHDPEHVN